MHGCQWVEKVRHAGNTQPVMQQQVFSLPSSAPDYSHCVTSLTSTWPYVQLAQQVISYHTALIFAETTCSSLSLGPMSIETVRIFRGETSWTITKTIQRIKIWHFLSTFPLQQCWVGLTCPIINIIIEIRRIFMLNILFKASLTKTLTKTFSVNNISDSKDKLQLKYQYKI